jgi:hypothetical protein
MEQNDVKQVLDQVVESRHQIIGDLEQTECKLQKLLDFCGYIQEMNNNATWKGIITDKGKDSDWDHIVSEALNTQKSINDFGVGDSENANKKGVFSMAKDRANRDYINIGIIAPFRQGKSTLLRNLLQFNDNETKYLIPTSGDETRPCTGTRICYVNDYYKEGTDGFAVIEFYNEKEIIASIKSLLNDNQNSKINESLNENPSSEQNSIPLEKYMDLIRPLKEEKTNPGSKEETLNNYIEHYNDYKPYIGKGEDTFPLAENLNKFYKYVCFFNDPDKQGDDDRSYITYAVKKATVYKTFKINGKDPGKIQFLDTPGIGEARTTVETSLSETLRSDIDIAIALCKTPGIILDNINEFNEFIKTDFNRECVIDDVIYNIKDCLYYVFNVVEEGGEVKGQSLCEAITTAKRSLESTTQKSNPDIKGVKLDNSHIRIVNCSKKDTLYNKWELGKKENEDGTTVDWCYVEDLQEHGCHNLLMGILDTLKNTISNIDTYFCANAKNEAKSLLNCGIYDMASELQIEELGITSEIDNKRKLIHDALKAVDPVYQDTSEEEFRKFTESGPKNIVNTFFTDNKLDPNNLLKESQYNDLTELQVYQDLKVEFKHFFINKLKGYFKVEIMKKDAEKAVCEVSNIMIRNGLSKVVTNNKELWMDEFVKKFRGKYDLLCNLFEDISNISFASECIGNFISVDHKECFHAEKPHKGSGEALFEDVEQTNLIFKFWLEDIAKSLIEECGKGSIGKDSFKTLLDKAKEEYRQKFTALRESLSAGKDGYKELGNFMDMYQDIIFDDLVKKNSLIKEWQNKFNEINHETL